MPQQYNICPNLIQKPVVMATPPLGACVSQTLFCLQLPSARARQSSTRWTNKDLQPNVTLSVIFVFHELYEIYVMHLWFNHTQDGPTRIYNQTSFRTTTRTPQVLSEIIVFIQTMPTLVLDFEGPLLNMHLQLNVGSASS